MGQKKGYIITLVGGIVIAVLSLAKLFNIITFSSDWFWLILGFLLFFRGIYEILYPS